MSSHKREKISTEEENQNEQKTEKERNHENKNVCEEDNNVYENGEYVNM